MRIVWILAVVTVLAVGLAGCAAKEPDQAGTTDKLKQIDEANKKSTPEGTETPAGADQN